MRILQIAGDELWPNDPQARVATAFLRHYPDESDARNHATILHTLRLNHINVTYMHNGRAERPTIVSGEVVKQALKNA